MTWMLGQLCLIGRYRGHKVGTSVGPGGLCQVVLKVKTLFLPKCWMVFRDHPTSTAQNILQQSESPCILKMAPIFSVIHQYEAVARLLLELQIASAEASLSSVKHKLNSHPFPNRWERFWSLPAHLLLSGLGRAHAP